MSLFDSLLQRRRSDWYRVTGAKRAFLIMTGVIVCALVFMRFDAMISGPPRMDRATVTIGQASVAVEVADDPEEQARGLSGRVSLKPGQGMLFLFNVPDRYGFWMKDMKFPIDVIWISGGRIVEVNSEVPFPEQGKPPITVRPAQAVDMVLEVPAGYARSHDWSPGLKVGVSGLPEKQDSEAYWE